MTAYVVKSPLISARWYVGEASLVWTDEDGRELELASLREDYTLT